MRHKHRNVLQSIFRDPVSSALAWHDVESLLQHLGATIEPSHGARFRVTLRQSEFFIRHPHHGNEFGREDIKHLRGCLAAAGISPLTCDDPAGE